MKYLFYLTIDTDCQVTLLTNLFKQFLVVSFTVTDKRSQQIGFLPFVMFQDQVKHLFFGVLHHLFPAQVRVSLTRPCIKQTEKVVYLCRSTYGRTGILIGRFLFDRDDRA